jgi:hypothetical protein
LFFFIFLHFFFHHLILLSFVSSSFLLLIVIRHTPQLQRTVCCRSFECGRSLIDVLQSYCKMHKYRIHISHILWVKHIGRYAAVMMKLVSGKVR